MKPREWLLDRLTWIAYEPGTSGLDGDEIHVREVLPAQSDTVTISREEFRRACKKFEYDSQCVLTSVSDVEIELFGLIAQAVESQEKP